MTTKVYFYCSIFRKSAQDENIGLKSQIEMTVTFVGQEKKTITHQSYRWNTAYARRRLFRKILIWRILIWIGIYRFFIRNMF